MIGQLPGQAADERSRFIVRSRVVTITPKKAAEYLELNTANRPLSTRTVREFAAAMRRGEWRGTHPGNAFRTPRGVVGGQDPPRAHRGGGPPGPVPPVPRVAAGGCRRLANPQPRQPP